MSLLEQKTTKRGQADKTTPQIELNEGSEKEYKMQAIIARSMPKKRAIANYQGSIIWSYGKTTLRRKILGNQHLINSVLPMARPSRLIEALATKLKHGPPAKNREASKQAKKS